MESDDEEDLGPLIELLSSGKKITAGELIDAMERQLEHGGWNFKTKTPLQLWGTSTNLTTEGLRDAIDALKKLPHDEVVDIVPGER